MTHDELKKYAREQHSMWRSIVLILERPFLLGLEDTNKLTELVTAGNKEGLKQWIKNHPDLDLGEMNVSRLRVIAQELGVYNYSRLSRGELIRGIKEMKNEK